MERSLRNTTIFGLGLVMIVMWWADLSPQGVPDLIRGVVVSDDQPRLPAYSNLCRVGRIIESMHALTDQQQSSVEDDKNQDTHDSGG